MASVPPPGPVLPWAHVDPAPSTAEAPPSADDSIMKKVVRTLEDLNLDIGARIEVRWEIEDEEKETATLKWWGASIESVPGTQPVAPEQKRKAVKYLLKYDAYDDFEAEDREVAFVSERRLLDLENDGCLKWRREGEETGDSDSDDEDMEEEEEEETAEGNLLTLDEWATISRELEPSSASGSSALNIPGVTITPYHERLVAEHLQDFVRGLMEHIDATKSEGDVVTQEDVWAYVKNKKPPPPSS